MSVKSKFLETVEYKCSCCHISEWNGSPLTLEMDHIDGNNKNNDFSNLRLLCPNCHSQTPTWRGRNIAKKAVSDKDLLEALATTSTIRHALTKVGLTPKGANYERASNLLNIAYREKKVQTNNSQFGTRWVNNGVVNKKIKADQLEIHLESSWILGRITTGLKRPESKGRVWYTDGNSNKFLFPTDEIPEGYWKGRAQ